MLENPEGIDPTWIIAVAAIITVLISFFGSKYLRELILQLFAIIYLSLRTLFSKRRMILRISLVLLSVTWVPILVLLFWSDLSKYASELEAWVSIILVSSFSTLIATLLLFRLKKNNGVSEFNEEKHIKKTIEGPSKLADMRALLSGVAVEMSDHITIIAGMTELLLSDRNLHLKTRQSREYVKAISKASRMIGIANKAILELSQQTESIEDFDLNRLCDDVLTLMLHKLKIRDIVAEKRYSKTPLIIYGDRSQIEQALIQLLSDSLNNIEPRKTLVLTTSSKKDGVKVLVSVKGVGSSLKYIGEMGLLSAKHVIGEGAPT